jgi:2-dehydropantoate 2-reductase
MRIAIVGAGAIGTYIGAQLAASGQEVALIARGAHLLAMQEGGVRVRSADGELTAHPFATEDPAEIGPVDVVFLTLKAQSLPGIAPRLAPLLRPETPVIAGQNGIPWWYFEKHGGPLEGTHLESVDPGGLLSMSIPIERVVGSVIYFSTVIEKPGVILHVEGNRVALGEPDGSPSERCKTISGALRQAGLKCPVRTHIRHDLWVKLVGNLALNPVSALTGATLEEMTHDAKTQEVIRAIMEEGSAVARAAGVELEIGIERRLQGAARVGAHKTSMLQDLEQGKPLELDCIVGAVIELADMLGVPVPCTRTVYACTKLLEKAITTRTQRPSRLSP